METKKIDLRPYGIDPAKGRPHENLIYGVALVYNLLQARVEEYLDKYRLSPVQFNLLMLAAYQNEGNGISQVELARHLIASASNITKLVEKLVRGGLLTRKTNPHSRRENVICATAKGRQLIDKVWPGYDGLLRALSAKIPSKQRPQIAQILTHWFTQLQQEN